MQKLNSIAMGKLTCSSDIEGMVYIDFFSL